MSQEKPAQDPATIMTTFDFNSLKSGEYTLHLYVEETRNLVPADEE